MTNDRAAEIMKAIIFMLNNEYYSDEVEEAIHMAINALTAQPERIQNNAVHLCDSCQYTYVTCPSHGNDAVFGDGKGNDNICACNKYRPISAQPEPSQMARDIATIIENEKDMRVIAQPETHEERTETHACDLIDRQAAIDAAKCGALSAAMVYGRTDEGSTALRETVKVIKAIPSAQPERRCANCGRTVNNGGWYEDGRTRCPIEEHYALPKDGYCHLWEKRKDWEDDYVKRAEEGEK